MASLLLDLSNSSQSKQSERIVLQVAFIFLLDIVWGAPSTQHSVQLAFDLSGPY